MDEVDDFCVPEREIGGDDKLFLFHIVSLVVRVNELELFAYLD
jgi:hypothetical protein